MPRRRRKPQWRKPQHSVDDKWIFTNSQCTYLHMKWKRHPSWTKRRYLGPKNGVRGRCIIAAFIPVHNPFYPNGPTSFTPYQVAFILKFKYLPKHTTIEEERVDCSHVCGDNRCINTADQHIVAQDHWGNFKVRTEHHKWCVKEYERRCKALKLENEQNDQKRKFRSSTKEEAFEMCIVCEDCTCSPTCFKNCSLKGPVPRD